MRSSFCLVFCVAVLFRASVKAENETDDSGKAFLESMNGLKEVYLQNWNSEIQDSQSVLVYPAAVLQEFLFEHAQGMPDGSPQKAKVLEVMPFDTGLPFALDLSNISVAPLQQLAIQSFYNNKTPDMNQTISDPYYFSYKAFTQWSKLRLEAADSDTPFNPLVTVAAIRINSIQSENFHWIDKVDFHVSQKQTIEVDALRSVRRYEYAEFSYPHLSNCTAGALRLQINDEASIIFVIARNVNDAQCNSSVNLLKILEGKTLETINFTYQRMFVSLPVLRVSTIVAPARKLVQLGLLAPKRGQASSSSQVFADHYESASLIFNPEVPADAPIPMIHPDTPKFEADRPFLVAVLQKQNPVPVLVGLIQNPSAGFECCSATEPLRISITFQNKGQRPNGH